MRERVNTLPNSDAFGRQPALKHLTGEHAQTTPPSLRTRVPDEKASSSVSTTCGRLMATTARQAAAQPGSFRHVSLVKRLS